MNQLFNYRVLEITVLDADTVRAVCDVGFHMKVTETFRLARIQAPELKTPEGKAAKLELIELIHAREGMPLWIKSEKTEKWRRWLAELWSAELNINDWLLEKGYATAWQGFV